MVTKKDFIKMANILKYSEKKEDIAEKIILWFKNDNPKFDENKFRTAMV